jgi:hypothetical protein
MTGLGTTRGHRRQSQEHRKRLISSRPKRKSPASGGRAGRGDAWNACHRDSAHPARQQRARSIGGDQGRACGHGAVIEEPVDWNAVILRILLADDHGIVRRGLKELLEEYVG